MPPPTSQPNIHQVAHIASTRQLYGTGEYSDLLLRCNNGRKFRVHRSVLCPRSKFFSRACSGDFSEANTSTIHLAEDDPDTVARMLEYIYTLDYDDGDGGLAGMVLVNNDDSDELYHHDHHHDVEEDDDHHETLHDNHPVQQYTTPTTTAMDDYEGEKEEEGSKSRGGKEEDDDGPRSALQNNALVYAMAEKYDIVELKALAIERFMGRATNAGGGGGAATAAAGEGGGGGIWPVEDFLNVVRTVYDLTPESDRGLRDALVEICAERLTEAMLDSDEFKAVAVECGAFILDLLRYAWVN